MKLSYFASASVAIAAAFTLASCGNSAEKAEKIEQQADSAVNAIDKVAETPAVTVIKQGEQIPPADNRLVVLDFNATWCGPCRAFAPNFEKVADKYRDSASFYSVDVDQNPALAAQYNVQSIPTIVFIKPDGTTSTAMGYMEEAQFDTLVADALK